MSEVDVLPRSFFLFSKYNIENLQNIMLNCWLKYGILIVTETKLISYTYDAWGNSKITYHSGSLNSSVNNNPFRYRGYYYDADFGLYYLQTRYYDSNTGRFINADGYVSTGQGILGNNMFAYCNNNPVMFVDPTGEMSALAIVGIVVVGVIAVAVAVAATANDIYQIVTSVGEATEAEAGDKLGYYVDEKNGKIQIHNSYKIITPWVQSGLSFYFNHFNRKTRGIIKGTTSGVQSEWLVHNLGYALYSIVGNEDQLYKSTHLNIGATPYNNTLAVATASEGVSFVKGAAAGAVIGKAITNRNIGGLVGAVIGAALCPILDLCSYLAS